MSTLADLLKQAAQAYSRPMGFAAVQSRREVLPLLLVAEVPGGETASVEAAVAAGAGAVVVGPQADVAGARKAAGGAALGVTLSGDAGGDAAGLAAAGCDFLLLQDTDVPAAVLTVDNTERLLALDPDWPDAVLRGVEGLPLDGVVYRLPQGAAELTVRQLLVMRRAAALAGKPLFVATGDQLPASAVQALRDAGAAGLIVPAPSVAGYAEAVRRLPPPKRKNGRLEAVLPAGFLASPREPAREDDDDDE